MASIGIISDIHANAEALDAVLADAAGDVDVLFCLGDVVGYGPDPGYCVDLLAWRGVATVLGNHDEAAFDASADDDFNDTAAAAIQWTRSNLDRPQIDWLRALPRSRQEPGMWLVHGAPPASNGKYLYPVVYSVRAAMSRVAPLPVCAVGHTHQPAVVVGRRRGPGTLWVEYDWKVARLDRSARQVIEYRPDDRLFFNLGSVGQPRDGNPLAAYAILRPDRRTLELRRVSSRNDVTRQKILKAGLPPVLGERLARGQ